MENISSIGQFFDKWLKTGSIEAWSWESNLIYKNFDLIFLDPPFKDKNINQLIEEIKKLKITNDKTIVIIHRNKKIVEKITNKLFVLREKNYGLSKIIFGKII